MVWLMVILLLSPVAVQAVHILEEVHSAAEDCHPQHDCSACPVCQFAFSVFIEAEFTACGVVYLPIDSERVALSHDRPSRRTLLSYALRAPPVRDLLSVL